MLTVRDYLAAFGFAILATHAIVGATIAIAAFWITIGYLVWRIFA